MKKDFEFSDLEVVLRSTARGMFIKYAQFIQPKDMDGDGDNALHDLAPTFKNVVEATSIILDNSGTNLVA